MRNLYSFTKGQQAIREITRATIDKTGNLPLFPGIFPDYSANRSQLCNFWRDRCA